MSEAVRETPPGREPWLRRLARADSPLVGLGMTSVVVGLIGLLLFLLPLLAIPISVFGLGFGVVGFGVGWFAGGPSLRWSAGGIVVSGLALTVAVAMNLAPSGDLPRPAAGKPAAEQPYPPPPPARPW